MRVQNKNNKILKFSIRKLSFGAAPIVIGALIFGNYMPTKAYASDNGINVNYTYLTENELTESEKSLIKDSIPSDLKNNETYYMVYRKIDQLSNNITPEVKSLPNTGESSLPLAGLGLGSAVLVVFLISKKYRNKVLSVVLIGTLGQSVIVPYHSFALENKDLVQYNIKTTITNSAELAKGIIHIDGYKYIGFFTQSDLKEFSHDFKNILQKKIKTPVEEVVSTKQEKSLTKVEKKENSSQLKTEVENSEISKQQRIEIEKNTSSAQSKNEEEIKKESLKQNVGVVKPNIEYKTMPEDGVFNLSINKPELRTVTEVIPFETTIRYDNTLPKGVTKVLNDGVNGEKVVFSEVTMVDGKETSRIIKTSITKNVVNKVIAVGTVEAEKGKSLVQPEKSVGVVSEKGEALVQPEKPEGVVSEKGEALVQPENPEGVVSEKGESLVQPENPKGVVSEKGEALVQPEKPEGVVSEKGEALVQPEKPEGVVSEKGEALVQPEKPEGVVSEKGEALVQPEKPEGVVSEKGEALIQPENPEGKINSENKNTRPAISNQQEVGTPSTQDEPKLAEAATPSQPTPAKSVTPGEVTSSEPVSGIQTTNEPVPTKPATSGEVTPSTPVSGTQTINESAPTKPATSDEVTPSTPAIETPSEVTPIIPPRISNEPTSGNSEKPSLPPVTSNDSPVTAPNNNPETNEPAKPIEKTAPILKLVNVEKHVMDRSADLTYSLENNDEVEIKSIVAEIKDGNEVIKHFDLTKDKLTEIADKLKFYKDYTITTKMVYNRGKGDEETTLEEKPLRLDLKKVEVKDIKETSLIHVNEQGEEIDSSLLNSIPDKIKEYYLKVTSNDNKTTKLAVDKIEEVRIGEDIFYKVSAKARDLVQRTSEDKINDIYSYYIAKPKSKIENVYYNFNELIRDMQENPTGIFKIGQNLNATNVTPNGKSYVTKKFTGTLISADENIKYAIHNLEHPLFNEIENGTIKNLIFSNVNINKPNVDQVATIAKSAKNTVIENIKVTGSIIAGNDAAGIVNDLDDGSTMTNVAVIGKIKATGTKGWSASGLINNQRKANVERVYANVEITGGKARGSALVSTLARGDNRFDVNKKGYIKKAVAKGTINLNNNVQTGGVISKNWPYGLVEDVVSYVKVENGEKLYGSGDIDDDDFAYPYVKNVVSVKGISTGNTSYRNSNKLKEITEEEAVRRVASYQITAADYEAPQLLVDKLNNKVSTDNEYSSIQDYDKTRELVYRNIEKLQPFYNKDWIVNQGNKIPTGSNLLTKKVLSVTAMKDTDFVTDSSDMNKIMIHYADGTKELFNISVKDSPVAQVKEYSIENLRDIVYTPNIVIKNRDDIEAKVKESLLSVELQSQAVRNILDKRDTKKDPTANSEARQNGYIRDLFLEESFKEVRDNIDKFVKKLLENEDHQLNDDASAKLALIKKIELNKTNIMLGLTYLNRYYGIKYNGMNIKEMMTFKPDFYGKNVDVIDRLIKIGSKESYIKGDRTHDAYREVIASGTGKGNLHEFLNYNMRLFTEDTNLNDWFKHTTEKNVYISEPTTTTQDFVNKKHRAYDGLNNNIHGRMILPLLNLKNAHIFLISTYNTLAYSSFEKYGKYTEEERNQFKAKIDEVANAQQRYLDFWSRLALPDVRNRLLKSDNMVPTSVWDNQSYRGGTNRYGYANNGIDVVAPVRELYGPTWRYHNTDGRMGAMARIYGRPYEDDAVFFMVTDMISPFGISAFTHETTHVNDRMLYYGGHWHREGTFLEAFAQGMLQTPDKSTTNGEYGALGLNMAYIRQNDGDQLYDYDPTKLQTRAQIDHYMKNYNEAMMMLDHLEADAVISKKLKDNSKWFKKVDKEMRTPTSDGLNKLKAPNQWDRVRDLNSEERSKEIQGINDLVENNFITKHGNPGNGLYRPEDFTPNSSYVNVNMMMGVFGGNTSDGAPGSLSFKHNAFRMWGYYGYEDGFIGYVSNKYKDAANKEKLPTLSDKYIIKKVSKGAFETLEAWKKHWYGEVLEKAKHGFAEIDIDNIHVTSYEQLQQMFNEAVQKDLDQMTKTGKESYGNTVSLKTKVFKQLLKVTDGFSGNLFK